MYFNLNFIKQTYPKVLNQYLDILHLKVLNCHLFFLQHLMQIDEHLFLINF